MTLDGRDLVQRSRERAKKYGGDIRKEGWIYGDRLYEEVFSRPIPKHTREKNKIGRKSRVVDNSVGAIVKPAPSPSNEKGSLKGVLSKSSTQIMSEVRKEESRFDRKKLVRKFMRKQSEN